MSLGPFFLMIHFLLGHVTAQLIQKKGVWLAVCVVELADFWSAQPTHLTATHPGLRARTLERGAGAKAARWDSSFPGEDQWNLP